MSYHIISLAVLAVSAVLLAIVLFVCLRLRRRIEEIPNFESLWKSIEERCAQDGNAAKEAVADILERLSASQKEEREARCESRNALAGFADALERTSSSSRAEREALLKDGKHLEEGISKRLEKLEVLAQERRRAEKSWESQFGFVGEKIRDIERENRADFAQWSIEIRERVAAWEGRLASLEKGFLQSQAGVTDVVTCLADSVEVNTRTLARLQTWSDAFSRLQEQESERAKSREETKSREERLLAALDATKRELLQFDQLRRDTHESLAKVIERLDAVKGELSTWCEEPLARRKDLKRRKTAAIVDFENVFIALCKMGLEITDFGAFKKFLLDPGGAGSPLHERLLLFTNRSRWTRSDYYDRNHRISQEYARKIKDRFRQEGFRVVEPDSNVDIPLALMATALAEKNEFEEFSLAANDGTYAGLVAKLSDAGCLVSGILLGEDASGDLVTCYKEQGFAKYHLKSRQDFQKFGIPTRPLADSRSPADSKIAEEDLRETLHRWGKKLCFTPVREEREKYLERLFEMFAQGTSLADMRVKLKEEFPESNGFCRYTLGRLILKAGNVVEEAEGVYRRVGDDLQDWLKKSERTWLEMTVECVQKMRDSKKWERPANAKEIVESVMGYDSSDAYFREFLQLCEREIQKRETSSLLSEGTGLL